MSEAIVPISGLSMTLKSTRLLKACLHPHIEVRNGEPYCTIKDALRALAKIKEVGAYAYDIKNPSFSYAGFGVVNSSNKTVALFVGRNKVLDAPLEALKDPKCLVGQVIQLGDTSLRCKILDIHVAESGTMYLAYKVL